MRGDRAALAWLRLATLLGASCATLHAEEDPLTRMELSLTASRPYYFVLAYRGPNLPFRGRLCYWFAGYNETCTDPHVEWLTPATRIELYAPGGVPRDLLLGYTMLVRFPALSERTYRYDQARRP